MYGQPDEIETPISHVPNRQPRREYQPRPDLIGTYDPYYPGHERRIPDFKDKTLNVDLGTQYESEDVRKKRIKEKSTEAQIARKKYLSDLRRDEANNRRDSVPSDMGFLKPGEADTDGDAPEIEEDSILEGFQEVRLKNKKTAERIEANKDSDLEKDYLVGNSHKVEDFSDQLSNSLEDRFKDSVPRKLLAPVNIEKFNGEINTTIRTDRIKNHRQRTWVESHGGNSLIQEIWEGATSVEVMIRSHGETQVVIRAGRELRLDVEDFFAMFSVSEVNEGNSCFEKRKFRLNNPADEARLKSFFEKVRVYNQKIGVDNNLDAPVTVSITRWQPREASESEKDTLADIRKHHETRWNSSLPTEVQYASPSNKAKKGDTNNKDIWKGQRKRLW